LYLLLRNLNHADVVSFSDISGDEFCETTQLLASPLLYDAVTNKDVWPLATMLNSMDAEGRFLTALLEYGGRYRQPILTQELEAKMGMFM